ncbi:hypothetical protein [Cerasicoccus frondis]|uniref:hypothetical protein n=1 Tax=Cerasicoccus frondis TaxID=490090 RepID=UPI00285266DA|nr:hypothetical protein [Cerasicoccus frondis]
MMNTRGKSLLAGLALALLFGCATTAQPVRPVYFDVPNQAPVALKEIGELPRAVNESSGLARGSAPGVFWTLNDSGDRARIFAIDAFGNLVGKAGAAGVAVEGARNQDWEDLASDFRGNLIIPDVGNNNNRRRNLTLYRVPEPDYATATSATPTAVWPIHYPEQWEFPPAMNNFDCEAVFVAQGKIYLLMKHRADRDAALYRLDSPREDKSNALTLVSKANLREMVTGAASWNDGEQVAVLTYSGIWLFTPPAGDADQLFAGEVAWLPIRAAQCEAICFLDADTLLITNEQREVFHVRTADLLSVSKR